MAIQQTEFAFHDLSGEIIIITASRQQRTIAASFLVAFAISCIVADGRQRPEVVHGPYHRFSALQNASDAAQREHALIDPLQVDDVGLLELPQSGDVGTGIRHVNLKETFPGEMEMAEQAPAFPEEVQALQPAVGKGYDGRVVAEFLAHQHLRLYAIALQRLHQTVGGNGGTTRFFARIYNQDFHFLFLSFQQR